MSPRIVRMEASPRDLIPRRGSDRFLVVSQIGAAVTAFVSHDIGAGIGWTSAAIGWWVAAFTRDVLDEAVSLILEHQDLRERAGAILRRSR